MSTEYENKESLSVEEPFAESIELSAKSNEKYPDRLIRKSISVELRRLYNLRAKFFRVSAAMGTVWAVIVIVRLFYQQYQSILLTFLLLSIVFTAATFAVGIGTYLIEGELISEERKRLSSHT